MSECTETPFVIVCDSRDETDWLQHRTTGIGASEAAVILGANPWKSVIQLYAEKTAQIEPDDLSDNEAVFWGKRLEQVVIDVYRERSGRFTDRGGLLLRSTRYPWALATLDAWTATAELGPYWPLEAKTAGVTKGAEWLEGPPEAYRIQVHWQMLVTDKPKATIACLLGGQRLVWCDVDRDEMLMRKLVHHGEQFWNRVQDRNPPAPDGTESARKTVHALYPEDTGEPIILPATLIDAADELEAAKLEEKALSLRKVQAENLLKVALGPAEAGVLPDGRKVSWRTQVRKAYSVAETKTRTLRISNPKER